MAGEELIGATPDDWEYTTLGAACELGGGDIQTGPFGSQLHAADYVPIGIPSIMPQNIGDNRIVEEGIARITPEDAKRLSRYLVRSGDIVYSRRGDVERRALVRDHENGWLCGTGCLRVRLGDQGPDPRFATYYLGHPSVREWIVRHAHGATMPNLNTSILGACPFVVPPRAEQRAIGHILGTLDDKIELNRRTNETLEAMARAMFKSWFVDFEPVRANAEGRDPGLPKALADLFPDRLVDSDLGKIPEGWEVRTLADICEKPQYGYTASASDESVGPKFLRITDINKKNWIDWDSVPFCVIHVEDRDKYALKTGDVVIARMADPGHGALIEEEVDAVFASYLIRFRPRQLELGRFLQYWLRSESYWNLVLSRQSGSTRANLNAQVLSGFLIVVPAQRVLRAFSAQTGSLRDKVVANVRESRTLAELRDTLLPRLISGELRVKDSEKFVAGEV
jgi:type I restriction enzyme S subunit